MVQNMLYQKDKFNMYKNHDSAVEEVDNNQHCALCYVILLSLMESFCKKCLWKQVKYCVPGSSLAMAR